MLASNGPLTMGAQPYGCQKLPKEKLGLHDSSWCQWLCGTDREEYMMWIETWVGVFNWHDLIHILDKRTIFTQFLRQTCVNVIERKWLTMGHCLVFNYYCPVNLTMDKKEKMARLSRQKLMNSFSCQYMAHIISAIMCIMYWLRNCLMLSRK